MNAFTKTLVISLGGFAICGALAFWLVLPSLRNLDNLNEEFSKTKTEISDLNQQILAYKTAESDLNKAVDKQQIFDAILAKEDLVKVIKQTENGIAQSKTSELRLTINDPFIAAATGKPATKNPKDAGPIVSGLNNVTLVPYQLSVKNDYLGMIELFSYLEHLPNFTEISSFQLTAEQQSAGSTTTQGTAKPTPHSGQIIADINAIYFAKKDASTKN